MKIGILGTRGIPNAYGGFEQFAQYLAAGLVKKQHSVSVYNSHTHPYQQKEWNGVAIIHCKDPQDKLGTAGQFLYDLNCLLDAKKRNFDILLQLGYTSNSIWYRLWPRKMIQIVNMDGLEWKRSKYSKPVQRFLRMAEKWAAFAADQLIADSLGIQHYLKEKYGKESVYIPYGADIHDRFQSDIPSRFDLVNNQYYLLIARMEPENNVQTIIEGYLLSGKEEPLVLVGGYGNKFGQYLRTKYGSSQIRFIGAVYDLPTLNSLRFYSKLYFHGHSVGGTNPSLLEAMSCQCLIAAHDNVFNKTILESNAFFFSDAQSVAEIIVKQGDSAAKPGWTSANLQNIRDHFNWEKIIDDYEAVFLTALKTRTGGHPF